MVYEDGRKQFVPFDPSGAPRWNCCPGAQTKFLSEPIKLTFPVLARRGGKGTVVELTDEATRKAINALMDQMAQK